LFLAVVVGVLGSFTDNSFAVDKAKALELSQALGQARLFAGLTDKERAELKSVATLLHCKEGERIIEQGKPLDRMFIVVESQAEV
jgi:signal-transduction protein with cAMP-binding, CBS, and nucleotidyltransferase domain